MMELYLSKKKKKSKKTYICFRIFLTLTKRMKKKIDKNDISCFEQILKLTHHKTKAARPLTTHQTNIHAGHCSWSKNELIIMDAPQLADQLGLTTALFLERKTIKTDAEKIKEPRIISKTWHRWFF